MGKRPRRTPAEKARAQYTNYAVKEPMELMEFLAAKMPDASRTKLKSLLSKRVVFVDSDFKRAEQKYTLNEFALISKNIDKINKRECFYCIFISNLIS